MQHHFFGIKTPKQLIVVILLAFLVPIITIVLITKFVTGGMKIDKSDPGMSPQAIAKRLQPVATVVVMEADQAEPVARSGEEVYKAVCAACHATGALNAPKIGDKAAWASPIKGGLEPLVGNAIKGVKQMPPRGGNSELSDVEVTRAVVYMANQSGATFKEPAAPAEKAPEKAAEGKAETEKAAQSVKADKPAEKGETAQAEKPAPAAAPAASAAADKIDGKAIYDKVCAACHATGVAQAPKAGDKEAWAPRLKAGMDTVYANAIKGKGAMPPKGGALTLSDAEAKAAVDYLAGTVK